MKEIKPKNLFEEIQYGNLFEEIKPKNPLKGIYDDRPTTFVTKPLPGKLDPLAPINPIEPPDTTALRQQFEAQKNQNRFEYAKGPEELERNEPNIIEEIQYGNLFEEIKPKNPLKGIYDDRPTLFVTEPFRGKLDPLAPLNPIEPPDMTAFRQQFEAIERFNRQANGRMNSPV